MATRTDQTTPLLPEIRELSDAEWDRLADDKARQYFGISAQEFERRLDAGEIDIEDPDAMRVAMVLRPRAEPK
ncbi:MAG TPA: hypothetical protein VMF09_12090 [Solirubrobacteraceae bacterium]|nr:hypothetical protein [Solirubrobacteraceae bacterium]